MLPSWATSSSCAPGSAPSTAIWSMPGRTVNVARGSAVVVATSVGGVDVAADVTAVVEAATVVVEIGLDEDGLDERSLEHAAATRPRTRDAANSTRGERMRASLAREAQVQARL